MERTCSEFSGFLFVDPVKGSVRVSSLLLKANQTKAPTPTVVSIATDQDFSVLEDMSGVGLVPITEEINEQ